jgi:hypothetical protein
LARKQKEVHTGASHNRESGRLSQQTDRVQEAVVLYGQALFGVEAGFGRSSDIYRVIVKALDTLPSNTEEKYYLPDPMQLQLTYFFCSIAALRDATPSTAASATRQSKSRNSPRVIPNVKSSAQ